MAYLRAIDSSTNAIYIFREQYGTSEYFADVNDKEPFELCLSADGEFLAYTFKEGTHVNVYNIREKRLTCVLFTGKIIKNILNMRFFVCKIQGNLSTCLGVVRQSDRSLGMVILCYFRYCVIIIR